MEQERFWYISGKRLTYHPNFLDNIRLPIHVWGQPERVPRKEELARSRHPIKSIPTPSILVAIEIMCKTTKTTTTATAVSASTGCEVLSSGQLLSHESSSSHARSSKATVHTASQEDSKNQIDEPPPSRLYVAISGLVILGGMMASEMLWRCILENVQHAHPILEQQVNRHILARHLGVDTLSICIIAISGWRARSIVWNVMEEWVYGKRHAVVPADYKNRLFKTHPKVTQIAIFFFWYQVKNSYDTFVWNDGTVYLCHHILAMVSSWAVIGPHFVHYYAVFFLSICETSTIFLCILSNFVDVPGLSNAFPLTNVVVGTIFATLFILFRCVAWPLFTHHFFEDTKLAFGEMDNTRMMTPERQWWLKFLRFTLTLLSFMQVLFFYQIVMIGSHELARAGLI